MNIDDIGFYVKKISEGIDKYANHELKRYGLTISQIKVLCFLEYNKDKTIAFKDIEKHLDVSHPTIIGLIKRLKQNGFVKVASSKIDRRERHVTLTEKRKELFSIMKYSHGYIEGTLTKDIDETELSLLKKLLCKVSLNVDGLSAAENLHLID